MLRFLKNTREVLGSLKHKKPTRIYCPRCCSPDLKLSSGFDLWLTPQRYLCGACGYVGPVVLELEKEEEK